MNISRTPKQLLSLTILLLLLFASFGYAQTAPATTSEQKAKEAKKINQIRAAVQRICPVSGIELGKHGAPIKVKVAGEEVFLCCKSCAKRKVNAKHWATIHSNFAKAQGKCVVMDSKLSKKSKFTVVEGRIFYVCCPPCIEKIKKDPKKFAKELDDRYAKYLASLKKAPKKQ